MHLHCVFYIISDKSRIRRRIPTRKIKSSSKKNLVMLERLLKDDVIVSGEGDSKVVQVNDPFLKEINCIDGTIIKYEDILSFTRKDGHQAEKKKKVKAVKKSVGRPASGGKKKDLKDAPKDKGKKFKLVSSVGLEVNVESDGNDSVTSVPSNNDLQATSMGLTIDEEKKVETALKTFKEDNDMAMTRNAVSKADLDRVEKKVDQLLNKVDLLMNQIENLGEKYSPLKLCLSSTPSSCSNQSQNEEDYNSSSPKATRRELYPLNLDKVCPMTSTGNSKQTQAIKNLKVISDKPDDSIFDFTDDDQESQQLSQSSSTASPDIKILKAKSCSRVNFAWQIARSLFTPHELRGHNCHGLKGKKKLDSGKLEKVQKQVFLVYPLENDNETERKKVWRQCEIGIDKSIRTQYK